MLKMFIQADTRPALAQDAGKRRLAHLDWLAPHVGAVQLQQCDRFVPALTQRREDGQPTLVATHDFAIDQD